MKYVFSVVKVQQIGQLGHSVELICFIYELIIDISSPASHKELSGFSVSGSTLSVHCFGMPFNMQSCLPDIFHAQTLISLNFTP